MRKILRGAVTSLATLFWLVPAGAHAEAAPNVVCGQRITHNIRLAEDLTNCPADGLIVAADHITIDLGGHAVDGVNAAASEGIADDGHRDVEIRNGVIGHFFTNGVALRNAPHSRVHDLTIRGIGAGGVEGDASAGVLIKDSPDAIVTGNTVMNDVSAYQSDGVDVLSSPRAVVVDNRLAHNAWDGMFLLDSPRSQVLTNRFDHNGNQGVEVNSGSDFARVAGNVASSNTADGIVVGAVEKATIEGNTFRANGDTGLFLFDLLHSNVSGNVSAGNPVGLVLAAGQHGSTANRVAHNVTSGNLSTGLVIDHAADNTLVANTANANQGKPGEGGGIIVFGASGNTLARNVANNNRDVGIGVFDDTPGDSAGNKLVGNTANFNRAHGIDAVSGTIDGGRNTAHHNTPRPNCRGVVCL